MYDGKALKKADPSTIQDKLLVGYQGWFTCAGDGEPGEFLASFVLPFPPTPPAPLSLTQSRFLSIFIAFAPPGALRNSQHVTQLEGAITDGFTGSITPYPTADDQIQTSGQTCRNTAPQNCTKRRGSELKAARNVICFLRGTKRL